MSENLCSEGYCIGPMTELTALESSGTCHGVYYMLWLLTLAFGKFFPEKAGWSIRAVGP